MKNLRLLITLTMFGFGIFACQKQIDYQPQISLLQGQITSLQLRCDSLSKALVSSNNTVLNISAEVLILTNNQNKQKLSLDSIRTQIAGILTSITNLNSQLSQQNTLISNLTTALAQANSNIALINSQIASINTVITTITNQYNDLLTQLTDILNLLNLPSSLTNGLVTYYPFTGNANDVIGNNNGTIIGASLTTDKNGNPNSAYSFDGISNYINLPNPFFNGNSLNEFSIYARFYINSSGNYNLWGKTLLWGQANLQITSSDQVDFFWAESNSGNTYSSITSLPNAFNLKTWTDVVVNFSNSILSIYVNGSLVSSTISYSQQNGTIISTTYVNSLINFAEDTNSNDIGAGYDSGNLTAYLNGKMDELRLYNRPLTQMEITYLSQH